MESDCMCEDQPLPMRSSGMLSWIKKENCSPRKWMLYIEGKFWRSISSSIISRESEIAAIAKKAGEDMHELLQLLSELEYKGAFSWAVKQLSMRSMFEVDLTRSLKRHSVSEKNIASLLEQLKSRGWINDAQKYQSQVEKMKLQGKSSKEIQMKMRRFSSPAVEGSEESGRALIEEDHDEKALYRFLSKQMGLFKQKKMTAQERQKLIHKCMRKGYSFDLVKETLLKFHHNADEESEGFAD